MPQYDVRSSKDENARRRHDPVQRHDFEVFKIRAKFMDESRLVSSLTELRMQKSCSTLS